MPSKVERLRVLDAMSAPDLWSDVRHREPGGRRSEPGPVPPLRRLIVVIVALGVSIAGSLVAIRALSGEETTRPLTVPGAERIVFGGGDGDAQFDLFSMNPDGSEVLQLTDTPSSEDQPSPSPEGSRIAFALRVPGDPGSYAIGVVDAGGGNRGEIPGTRLETRNPIDGPAWSPDGSEIAFAAYGEGGGIYVVGIDGGSPRRLTSAGPPTTHIDTEPVWSPSGDAIAFIRWILGDSQESSAYEILTVSSSGGEPTLIARFPAPTQEAPNDNGEVRGLSWSPDGSELAFANEGAVFTVDPDDGQPREVISCEPLGCDRRTDVFTDSTTWSSDSQRIAFTAWVNLPTARADAPVIYVATFTAEGARLTSTGVEGSFPAWQPVPGM
jgi:Tol biopolymer transport system component